MKKALIAVIILGMVSGLAFSAESPETKELSLKDAIYYALKNNLGLQVQKAAAEVSRLSWRIAKAQLYLPTLEISSSKSKSKQPSTNITDGVPSVEDETTYWSATINQRTPLGGTLSIQAENQRRDSNVKTSVFNPVISTAGTITFSQPLLQNFGTLATNYQIYVAGNNNKISKYQLEETIVTLVYDVESAYWELVYAHQYLEAAKMALKRAMDFLHQNEVKVKVGTIAPIEVLSSKATVARNESSVIQAEQAIQTREEALKRILNISKEPFSIIPTDSPEIKDIPVDFNEFLNEALKNRADLKRLQTNVKNSDLTVKYQKNQLLPNLTFNTVLVSYGVGGTLWRVTTTDPYDPDFQRILVSKRTFKDTIKDLFKLENNYYSVGLNLEIPIPFNAEKAQVAQARVQLKQGMLQLKDLENTVYSQVKDVIKTVESNKKLVEADKIALELDGENLKAEEKKLSVGISTNFQVLQYQQQYATTQTQLLRSTISYVLTLARINQVLNRTLKEYDIKIKDILEK